VSQALPSTRPRRSTGLVVLDVVLGVVIGVVSLVFGLTVLWYADRFGAINDGLCTGGPYSGLECNATALSITVNAMIAVTVVGWAVTSGMFIVNLIKRRWAFYWTLIGFAVLLVTYYVGTAIVGQIAAAS
jgi:hypothetical protein